MIHFDNTPHALAIAAKAGTLLNPGVDNVISRTGVDGRLLGGVIYKEFTGASVQAHIAGFGPNWLGRDLLWVIFDYPFNQLGVSKIFGPVPETNKAALAFDYKLGFKYVTTIPGVFLDGGLIVLEMDRVDCRWLKLTPYTLSDGRK